MIWYVLGLLALTLAINHLSLLLGFVELSYTLTTGERDYEIGEEIPVVSTVENNKLLSVSFLKVEEYFPPGFSLSKNVYSLFILPFQRVKRTYKIRGQKRGHYRVERAALAVGDFVGFSSEKKSVALAEGIVILPKKAKLAESIVPLGPLGGDISVRRWIIDDPLMTIGVREYTGNEPQRFIHWPSTAKQGDLMVKKFDFTTDNSALIILNVETRKPCWLPIEEELIDEAVSLARGIMEEFEELKVPYGLATNAYNEQTEERGCYRHPGLGRRHLTSLLHTLGSINFRIPVFFENTLAEVGKRRGNYTTGVVVTPRLLESYQEPLSALAQALPRTVVIAVADQGLEDLNAKIIKYRGRENV